MFVEPASGWADEKQTAKLTASDGAVGNDFATSAAISGGTVAATARCVTRCGLWRGGDVARTTRVDHERHGMLLIWASARSMSTASLRAEPLASSSACAAVSRWLA